MYVLYSKEEEMSRWRVVVEKMGVVEVPYLRRDEHGLSGKLLHLTWPRDWIMNDYASVCLED